MTRSIIICNKTTCFVTIIFRSFSLSNFLPFSTLSVSTHRSESSFSGGGCNRVLNIFYPCSYICFLVSSLFSSSQSSRILFVSSPLCCSLLIATSLSSSYNQVSNSVCLSCVCVYSCTVSRTHFSSHRYLAIIVPTISSHTILSRFICTRRYSLLVVTTKRQ